MEDINQGTQRDRSPVQGTSNRPSKDTKDRRSLKQVNPVKYSAPVYELFYRGQNDDPEIYHCCLCDANVKKGKGGQTNLKKHVERNHCDVFKDKLKPTAQVF